jgi:alpha-tubulin suppressor-like RCC1 family protein
MSSCARTVDDRVLCCGENAAGQLGLGENGENGENGTNERRNAFTLVTFP